MYGEPYGFPFSTITPDDEISEVDQLRARITALHGQVEGLKTTVRVLNETLAQVQQHRDALVDANAELVEIYVDTTDAGDYLKWVGLRSKGTQKSLWVVWDRLRALMGG